MTTIDYRIGADGYVHFNQTEGKPIPSIRCLAILEDEGVTPNHHGAIYLQPNAYRIIINQS